VRRPSFFANIHQSAPFRSPCPNPAPMPGSPSATVDDIRDALLAAERVVLTSHIRPDGDAIGSEIAVALFLKVLGKEVIAINSDAEPRRLGWLIDDHADGLVEKFEEGKLSQIEALANADTVMVLDVGAAHRLGKLADRVKGASAKKLLLDHHPDAEGWFDVACVRTEMASTGELVYELIAGHDPELIDEHIATALYAAIMTDTGSFRYGATRPSTHRVVADLLERGGISPEPIHINLFDQRSRESLRLLARALETITTHYDGRLATMVITQDILRETGAYFDETEGLINYALGLKGVVSALIFLETLSGIKVSFRSKGDCPINDWAAQFGGGGHKNAAGAYVRGMALHRVVKDVIDKAPLHVMAEDADESTDDDISQADLALLTAFKGKLD